MPYKDRERQLVAKAESARRHRVTRVEPKRGTPRGTLGPLVSGELRVATAADVLAVIEGQLAAVLGEEQLGTAERARTAATLCGLALRAIEGGQLAARLEALERHLKARAA